MKIKKIIPSALTILNAVFGLLAIINSIEEEYITAAVFLIIAVLVDFLDGQIARYLKEETDFGKEFDSLADIISFGVAPAIFVYKLGNIEALSILVLMIFVACGITRLARFNIKKLEYFEGMPITMNGLIVPIFYFIGLDSYLIYVLLISGLLMISTIKFPKIRFFRK